MRGILILIILALVPLSSAQMILLKEPVRLLALGDSYTIGQGVSMNERWPVQLITRLNNKYDSLNADVDIIAQTGWTTSNLITGIKAQYNENANYNLVSLLIGVNNQYQGRSIILYEQDLRQLMETAIRIAGDPGRVFVLSIPDYSYTPSHANISFISKEIDAYNAIKRRVSEAFGTHYFNITDISRLGLERPEYVATDRLHPSGIQYREWVKLIIPEISVGADNKVKVADDENTIEWNYQNGNLIIQLPKAGGMLSVYDLSGRLISNFFSADRQFYLPAINWKTGIYILKYQIDDMFFSRKIIIN